MTPTTKVSGAEIKLTANTFICRRELHEYEYIPLQIAILHRLPVFRQQQHGRVSVLRDAPPSPFNSRPVPHGDIARLTCPPSGLS